ncbi:MAG: hypothetical protein WC655_21100 [Candidatus Hydrogenedentales bacterium]|jgi:hypothetical protein
MRSHRYGLGKIAVAAMLSAFLWPGTAHAYLDGGTAALLFQALAAGVFGALFVVKMFWARIKAFFRKLTGRTPRENDTNA